ncbi:hypothetical protein OG259_40910 [Streptomyces sp. NBC_00250]|uniref:hypothetical protein n=1 Tax=Streptomyces sp. NBC_00250 TaxID=2903641 RepID=UPI002E2A0DEE|nr:hypothetical protein [Streptomyces sp. NBC_00250]
MDLAGSGRLVQSLLSVITMREEAISRPQAAPAGPPSPWHGRDGGVSFVVLDMACALSVITAAIAIDRSQPARCARADRVRRAVHTAFACGLGSRWLDRRDAHSLRTAAPAAAPSGPSAPP